MVKSMSLLKSGALDGVTRAIREMSYVHANKRDGIVRDREKDVISGKVYDCLTC